jgi:oxygen-dependent protoporphyrinogen oxidase
MRASSAIVVGAGLAGLTAGYYLSKAGWNVRVIDAASYVGGRVSTLRKSGYTLDTGATQLSSGYREYLALCDELGLRSQVVASSSRVGVIRHAKIHVINGKNMVSAPFTRLLSLRGKWKLLRTIRDFLALRPTVDPLDVSANWEVDTESTATYAARRVGLEVYEALMDPVVRAYVMNRASNVSVLEWFSALKILTGEGMLSMNNGNDCLPLALANQLDVRLNCPAVHVSVEHAAVRVDVRPEGGGLESLYADRCILATRLPEAISLCDRARAIAGRLGEIGKYNRGLVIHLGYSRRPSCPAVGFLLGAAEHEEIGLIWLEHNKNSDRAPHGHALFTLYFDEAVADRCYQKSDRELVSISGAYIEQLFPELKGLSDFDNVTRWPLGILNPAPGIYREVHAMKSRVKVEDPVQLAGDYFTCVGQNSAIFYGKSAAERLIAHAPSDTSTVA